MAYNRIKHVESVANDLLEEYGYGSMADFGAEDIEYIGMECQCAFQDVAEILGIALPKSLRPVAA